MIKFEVSYGRKSSAVLITPVDGDTGARLQEPAAMYLGDFLRQIGVTPQECAGAMHTSMVSTSLIPRINDWDKQQIKALPADMSGKIVLDIGGYDGYVAKACLERGASRAIVVDNLQHQRYTLPGYPYGWASARRYEGVEYRQGDLMDFSTWMDFAAIADIVLCLNVIYHVPDPLGAIERLRLVTKDVLYISSSVTDSQLPDWRWMFDSLQQMFFTPSKSGLVGVLEYVGFSNIKTVWDDGLEIMLECKSR